MAKKTTTTTTTTEAAPATDSGRMVMIVTGSLKELNCEARIM